MTRLKLWCWLPLLLVLTACTPAHPPRPDSISSPPLTFHFPQVERRQLTNGIRLYLHPDHELPLVKVTAMIDAGAIADPPGKTGLSGLFAALLGTGGAGSYSPDAYDAAWQKLAADLAVHADSYAVTIAFSVRADDLPAALELLATALRAPAFDSGRLELARREGIERVRRQNDHPYEIAERALRQAIYGDHPLGRTPTVASLKAVTRDDLTAFGRRYLHPNNLWLAISGDFDEERLLGQLDRAFSGWVPEPFAPQPLPPLVSKGSPAILVAAKALPQTTILLGELGIDKSSPDLFAVRVMDFILGGGGFNSHLMREIRSNRGLAYSVYSQYDVGRRLPGLFMAVCATKSGSTLEVVRLMRGAMERMRQTPVGQGELGLAKQSLVNSFVFAFADSHVVTARAMRLDFYGYPADYLQRYRDNVEAVTADDVLRVARRYLHPERQTLVLVGDPGKFDANPATLGLPVKTLDMKEP